jgi:peroxiredoxin
MKGPLTTPIGLLSLRRKLLLGIGLVLILAAVLLFVSQSPGARMETQQTAAAEVPPGLKLRLVDGSQLELSNVVKKQPVILYFMAAWCTSCVAEARALSQIYKEFAPQGLEVIAVDVDPTEGAEDLERFKSLAGNGGYRWAFDRSGELLRAFQVRYLDTTLVIGRGGRIMYRDEMPTLYGTLRTVVIRALSDSNFRAGCC